ncbi:uncharacterized protein (DUF697 family) [Azospirillum agricola]|uniref:YcjF family protein n=1 Tax=Azospirillum agricola TaxID=1720247 RepID=UPI001AE15492|nr:DUF697 domain-containing protein [Azospirillum agricola]MBP2227692.1 uncharacterized protein (DUF697 family) [Azospirillum agricola]
MTENLHTDVKPAGEVVPVDRRAKADEIVRKHAILAAGLGLIPVPVLDLAAISGAQYKMIRELADLYGVPASNDRLRSIVTALLGGGLPFLLSTGSLGAVAKSIPVVGTVVGIAVMPSLAGAATLALGRVFTAHFRAGGKLLDLDVDELREHFHREFEAAKSNPDDHGVPASPVEVPVAPVAVTKPAAKTPPSPTV